MDDIFSGAVLVISWLCDSSVSLQGGQNGHISDIFNLTQQATDDEKPPPQTRRNRNADKTQPQQLARKTKLQKTIPLFEAFLSHRYGRRRWIVQEVSLARSAVVRCGPHVVPFAHISEIVDYCSRRLDKNFSDSLDMRLCRLHSSISPMSCNFP